MRIPSLNEILEDRNFATIILVFMSVQFIAFEGMAVSIPKVVFMCFMPIIFLWRCHESSKALMWGFTFLLFTIFICQFQPIEPRYSTFGYAFLFIMTFVVYYNLIWIKEAFSLEYFVKLISWLIYAYAICLILQQLFFIAGIRTFAPINLVGGSYYAVNRLNTLAIEPSHAARLLTVFFYAFLKCLEYAQGSPVSIKELFSKYKWVVLAFLYTMIFIGSGTAFVGIAILSLYFLKKEYAFFVVVLATIIYFTLTYIDYEPLNRAQAVLEATMTGDKAIVRQTDNSAASRVNMFIDTFNHLDLTDSQTWIGHGIDAPREYAMNSGMYDYGMISYLLKLMFFLTCCFTGLFSLETLMFIVLFGMNIGNIAYGWSALMVFSTIKYFKQYRNNEFYGILNNYQF